MKDIIIQCSNARQISNIINSIPTNRDELPYEPKRFIETVLYRKGDSASFRIKNGAICGYDCYNSYNNSKYVKYPYNEVIEENLSRTPIETINDLMNISIKTPTFEEADELIETLGSAISASCDEWRNYWHIHDKETTYTLDWGKIRYYGYAGVVEGREFLFSEVRSFLPIIKMASENKSVYVRVKTREQAKWFDNHLGPNTVASNSWERYGEHLVVRVYKFNEIDGYDAPGSPKTDPLFDFTNGRIIRIGREETAISFTQFKSMYLKIKTAIRKINSITTLTQKYIKCKDVFEAREVCNKHNSLIASLSNVYWLKCWGKDNRTVYKLINNKIAGVTTEDEVRASGASVTRFSTVFSNIKSTTKTCSCCGHAIENGVVSVNGDIICQECLKDFTICEECGELERVTDIYTVDGKKLCHTCYETETATCMDCGEVHLIGNMTKDNTGNYLCTDCIDKYYICDRCCIFVLKENAHHEDGLTYCEACHDRVLRENSIRDYYYKPIPLFHGGDNADGRRFFGVELEVDGCGEDCDNAYEVLKVANVDADHVYIKHDGSLDHGFEVVSYPMTLDYHASKMPWEDTMKKLINFGYRSHQTNTCGLHVHVNRDSLGVTESEQEETIAKILFFVELHWNEIVKFTRRAKSRLDRWASRYGYETKAKKILDKAKECGRYTAVNLQNEHTIEFRVFRGTLKYNTFVATLQFVNAICNFACTMSEDDIEKTSWFDFVEGITEPELIQYLKERKLYVNEEIEIQEEI